jgi:hypothetical protein
VYEWVTVKIIHIKPLYADVYERELSLGGRAFDLESAFDAALHPQSFIDNVKTLLLQADDAATAARSLLKANGAKHPGIQAVITNFHEYLLGKWRSK